MQTPEQSATLIGNTSDRSRQNEFFMNQPFAQQDQWLERHRPYLTLLAGPA